MSYLRVFIDSSFSNCQSNLIGCSMLYRYIIENGHEITYENYDADYIIINSCGYTKETQEISIKLFDKYYSEKKKNAIVIMVGCLTKIDKERLNCLDLFKISNDESYKLDDFFYKKVKFDNIKPYCNKEKKNKINVKKEFQLFWENIPFLLAKAFFLFSKKIRINFKQMSNNINLINRSYVEIARGCISDCSYCIIKKAKGDIKSRRLNDILSDIEVLYDSSKNIALVADDCGSYGLDINSNLIDLIYKINKKFPNLSFDINYINPFWLEKYSKEYIKLFRDIKINGVTIPIQSGSNKIIKSMNRKYEISKVIKIVDEIKKVSPKTLLSSQFIVGYPGEITSDFIRTLFVAKHFDYPVPFMYSDMVGTKSESLTDKKSKILISLRWFIFILYINFTILIRLFSYPFPKK